MLKVKEAIQLVRKDVQIEVREEYTDKIKLDLGREDYLYGECEKLEDKIELMESEVVGIHWDDYNYAMVFYVKSKKIL